MKFKILVLTLLFSSGVFASGWGNGNGNQPGNQDQDQDQAQGQAQQMGQGQGQAQSSHNQNILAAAATGKASVDLDTVNENANLNVNIDKSKTSSYSEGSDSRSNSGALSGSKSRAGDNINKITIEGDNTEYPPASAMAGIATECVNTLAAQSKTFGISLGGESSDCKALRTALAFFQLASTFETSDPDMAKYYMDEGHHYAKKAGVTSATLAMSETRSFLVDFGISVAILAKLALFF